MDRDRRTSLWVGLFALAALAAFAGAVLSLTAERGFWKPRYRLVAYFESGQGLVQGAPVRLAGKDVGSVDSVGFSPLGSNKPAIRVGFSVDSAVQDRIRSDSQATIGTIGLLGDRYVEISLGSEAGQVLANGAEVPTTTPLDISDVMAKGTQALDDVGKLAANLNQVVQDFGKQMGAARIADAARAFADVAIQIREGKGLLHSLIYEPSQGRGLESLDRSLVMLENALSKVAQGDGVLHALIYEQAPKGDFLAQTAQAAERLNSILGKVDRGEGTLGMLVSDPTLYDDLKQLVGGARRSLLVRSLVRMSTDSGNKDSGGKEP